MGTLKERAHELLTARLEHLENLDEAQQRILSIQESLRDAERSLTSAWNSAIDAGWTPAELRSLGVSEPPNRRPGRPRTRGGRAAGRRAQTPPASALPDAEAEAPGDH